MDVVPCWGWLTSHTVGVRNVQPPSSVGSRIFGGRPLLRFKIGCPDSDSIICVEDAGGSCAGNEEGEGEGEGEGERDLFEGLGEEGAEYVHNELKAGFGEVEAMDDIEGCLWSLLGGSSPCNGGNASMAGKGEGGCNGVRLGDRLCIEEAYESIGDNMGERVADKRSL